MSELAPRSHDSPTPPDGARLQVVDPGAQRPIDVVMCCAPPAAGFVVERFPALVSENLAPRVVSGIEASVDPFVAAIARARVPTLFVLCVGEGIDGAQTHRLVEAFTARRGPLHRLLVVELVRGQTHAWLTTIRRGALSLRRQLTPGTSSVDAMQHSGLGLAVHGAAEVTAQAERPPPPARPRVVVADLLRDDVGTIPEHVRVAGVVERSRPVLEVVREPQEQPRVDPTADTDELPEGVAEAPSPTPMHPAAPSRDVPSRGRWVAGAAGVGLALGLALSALPDSSTDVPRRIEAVALQHGAGAIATAIGEAAAPPEPKATAEPRAARPQRPTPAHEAAEAALMAAAEEADRLDAALQGGRIRELDLLLVAQTHHGAKPWRAGAAQCRTRSVSGIRGWRLPKPAELRELWRHKMVPQGLTWTGMRVPRAEVPSNLAWNSSTRRMVVLPKHDHAHALCVRKRPGT